MIIIKIMDYKRIYYSLINSCKDRVISSGVYYEKHHILPKCFGGKKCKSNIVYLTCREHFIAHKLLFLLTNGKDKVKMGYALHRLCTVNNSFQQHRITNSRQFEKVKERIYAFINGSNHPAFGHEKTDIEKKNISERMLGEKNHRYGKPPWNKGLTKETDGRLNWSIERGANPLFGKPLSVEHRMSISSALKGKNKYLKSEAHKQKISIALKDRKLSQETKFKMSASKKGIPQKKIKCPVCGKKGGITMYRWHFGNCKYKEADNGKL
jgi:hypothetical protein